MALWREALLARAVLGGRTRGYRHHPQLERFRGRPASAINFYLREVANEAAARGYRFDRRKIGPVRVSMQLPSTRGQLDYEWQHLLRKLRARSPQTYGKWRTIARPDAHPLFAVGRGEVEEWERLW